MLNKPEPQQRSHPPTPRYHQAVNVNDLNADQLKPVVEHARRRRDYLTRMRDRMRALGFPEHDPLRSAVEHELEAVSNTVVVATQAFNHRPVMERKPWAG